MHYSTLLQTRNHESIQLLYYGKEVSSLTNTKIIIINVGKSEIRKEDIDQTLKIRPTNNSKLLSASVVDHSKNKKIKIDTSKNNIDINFNYLNRNDYFIIEVDHEGIISKEDYYIADSSTIIGGEIINVKFDEKYKYNMAVQEIPLSILGLFTIPYLLYGIPIIIDIFYEEKSQGVFSSMAGISMYLILTMVIIIVFIKPVFNIKNNISIITLYKSIPEKILHKFINRKIEKNT